MSNDSTTGSDEPEHRELADVLPWWTIYPKVYPKELADRLATATADGPLTHTTDDGTVIVVHRADPELAEQLLTLDGNDDLADDLDRVAGMLWDYGYEDEAKIVTRAAKIMAGEVQ